MKAFFWLCFLNARNAKLDVESCTLVESMFTIFNDAVFYSHGLMFTQFTNAVLNLNFSESLIKIKN